MKSRLMASLAVLFSPSVLQACTVCFGGADSNLVRGFTWGVVILLALPFAMAAGFITYIARASRKAKAAR